MTSKKKDDKKADHQDAPVLATGAKGDPEHPELRESTVLPTVEDFAEQQDELPKSVEEK